MLETIDQIENTPTSPLAVCKESDHIEFEDVTCFTPKGRALWKNVSFTVESGKNCLVTGPSGSGKTSLVRCLSGLWPFYEGTIHKPKAVFYLPQIPYLPIGNIVDQIVYPLTTLTEHPNTAEIQRLLTLVDLDYLLDIRRRSNFDNSIWSHHHAINSEIHEHLDHSEEEEDLDDEEAQNLFDPWENQAWTEVLSPGEQQRIALLRLLYHRPRFAILDEATSCVNMSIEREIYQECARLGITLISIAHRLTLKEFHSTQLDFQRKGGWEFQDIE